MKEQRIVYFDYLRIFAIFAVVMIHVSSLSWSNTNIHHLPWQVINFYNSSVRWGAPLFVMISGALFLGKEQSLKKLYTKNILRIVIVFLFWSAFYAISTRIIFGINHSLERMIINTFKGHYHMWFLFMIVGMYMAVPFINKIVADKKIAWYFVILAFAVSFLIPQIKFLISIRSKTVATVIDDGLFNMNLFTVEGHIGYFVLGYLLHHCQLNRKHRITIYCLGIFGWLVTVFGSTIYSKACGVAMINFQGNMTPNVFFFTAAIFVFAKTHLNKPIANHRGRQLLSHLAKCTFGVFLLHPFFISVFTIFWGISPVSFHPIVSVPVLSLAVFVISLAVSVVLNRIPVVKKWLV
jgi:surface polysaccharide O-acyltransferase-like enzyme